MRKLINMVLAIVLSSTQAAMTDPPGFSHRGKFFYTQVYYDPDDTQHYYVNMKIGCNGWAQKWLITTQEESVGYVTEICDE